MERKEAWSSRAGERVFFGEAQAVLVGHEAPSDLGAGVVYVVEMNRMLDVIVVHFLDTGAHAVRRLERDGFVKRIENALLDGSVRPVRLARVGVELGSARYGAAGCSRALVVRDSCMTSRCYGDGAAGLGGMPCASAISAAIV
jgi:hypothetical protein